MTSAHRAWVSLLALCLSAACAQAPSEPDDTADDDAVNEPPPSSIVDGGSSPDDASAFDARKPTLDASEVTSRSDAARLDSGPVVERDASALDAGEPDAANPTPEAAMPPMEAGAPEAGPPEAAVPVEAGANDAGLRCPPGRYSGSFGGRIEALFGIITIDLSGTITIEISAPPVDNPNMLPIRNGKLDGKDSDGNPLVATISGTLNCATRRLENGRITNGSYTRPDPIWMTRDPITVNFTGTATAIYNYDPPSATGQWETENSTGSRVASGTWSAVLVR